MKGTPVLLNEANSVFTITDYVRSDDRAGSPRARLPEVARHVLPELSWNARASENYALLGRLVGADAQHPRILIIGVGEGGRGSKELARSPGITLVETDVVINGRSAIVCDAHDLCFPDQTFDAVVVQAVLQSVVDPHRCADEIHRVLRPAGLVYSEAPFMQQVCCGAYDFTRFTPLGHRRLFRKFAEVRSGSVAGPGVVMAWSYSYLLQGFTATRGGKLSAVAVARVTGFWLKYLDRLLVDRPGAQDGSSCTYFLGRRSEETLADRELVRLYRGIV